MRSAHANSGAEIFMAYENLVKAATELATDHFKQVIRSKHPQFNTILPIPGTRIFASPGPLKNHLAGFLHKILSPSVAATHIIALGDCLAEVDGLHQDFHNYALALSPKSQLQFYQDKDRMYRVEIENKDVTPDNYFIYPMRLQYDLKGVMHTTLNVAEVDNESADAARRNPKELQVTLMRVVDSNGIELTPKMIAAVLELFQQTCLIPENNTVIHCKSGKGRTGHLLFAFRLMHNYQEIFGGNNTPEMAATKILEHLTELRKVDADFVHSKEQFVGAINLAHQACKLALSKHLKSQPSRSIFSPIVSDEIPLTELTSLNLLLTQSSNADGSKKRSNSLQ